MFSLSKTIAQAASTGLVLGAMTGCGGSGAQMPDAKAPSATDATAAAAGAKECCKGKNECKGKGSCKTDANACAGQNECKGKGGCNGHCPK